MIRARRPLAVLFALWLWPAFPAAAQNYSARFWLADWELEAAADIRYGQVSVVRGPDGERASVHALRDFLFPRPAPATKPATFNGEFFLISNYDFQMENVLGGRSGAFSREPSSGLADLRTTSDGRRALALSVTKTTDGFCGLWIHFFQTDADDASREFLNASFFSRLVFWIRGDAEDLQAVVKIADIAWHRRDDALTLGPIGNFLPSKRIETGWQLASIPLASLPPSLDRWGLATLAIEMVSPGPHRLEIKGLALTAAGAAFPLSPPTPPAFSKAVWVWNTDRVLASADERASLLSFLRGEGIDLVYLALPYEPGADSCAVEDARMTPLLSALREAGIRTQALFGDRTHILPENHAFVLETVRNVIEYNNRAPAAGRFAGIHLDIEPYLLRGFNGRSRAEFLSNFVLILSRAADLAHSGGLEIGADIPPWFDQINEYSGDLLPVTRDDQKKPLHEHVIDLMDQVTLMDYRTSASGPNGTIGLAVGELAYAVKRAKKVYIGLETGPVADERLFTFRGRPASGPEALPEAPWAACIHGPKDELTIDVIEADKTGPFRDRIRESAAADRVELWWPVFSAPRIAGSSISFAGLGKEALSRTIAETAAELSLYPSFAGFAVHDYPGYRRLVSGEKK